MNPLVHILSALFFLKRGLNGKGAGLLLRSKWDRTPVALIRSYSDKYTWENNEPPYTPRYGLKSIIAGFFLSFYFLFFLQGWFRQWITLGRLIYHWTKKSNGTLWKGKRKGYIILSAFVFLFVNLNLYFCLYFIFNYPQTAKFSPFLTSETKAQTKKQKRKKKTAGYNKNYKLMKRDVKSARVRVRVRKH